MVDTIESVYNRTVLLLALPSRSYLSAPHLYSQPIRLSTWSTAESLTIVFYDPSPEQDGFLRTMSPASRSADWDALQRFLGVIYGTAGQEAARVSRILLQVDVILEGLHPHLTLDNTYDRYITPEDDNLNDTLERLFTSPPDHNQLKLIPSLRSSGRDLTEITVQSETTSHLHDTVALGGTFDHLHGGHKILLTMAVWICASRLVVGMTVDQMLVSKAFADQLETFDVRAEHLRQFLIKINPNIAYDLVALTDVCGPTASDGKITALVVSRESLPGSQTISAERSKNGLPALTNYVIDVISATRDLANESSQSGQELPVPELLVEGIDDIERLKEQKLGSTYIRQWLSQRMTSQTTSKNNSSPERRVQDSTYLKADLQPGSHAVDSRTNFEASSQCQRWTYSFERLVQIRQEVNNETIRICRRNWHDEQLLQQNKEIKIPTVYPTWKDERLLVRYFATAISGVIEGGSLSNGRSPPSTLEPVAITFLKRFYLRTSILEWHPKVMWPVCLFLAGKVCNHVFDIDQYVSAFEKLKREDILGVEYLVLQTLHFDVYVPRIQDAVHGWYLKLQDMFPDETNRVEIAYGLARGCLKRSRYSDAEFLFTPSQIAAACFLMADSALMQQAMSALLPSEVSNQDSAAQDVPRGTLLDGSGLLKTLLAVKSEIETVPVDCTFDAHMDTVKAVNQIVRRAKDPAKTETAALYRERKLELEKVAAAKAALRDTQTKKDLNERETFFGPQMTKGDQISRMGQTGTGIKAESGGLIFGGGALRDVGMTLDDSSDSD